MTNCDLSLPSTRRGILLDHLVWRSGLQIGARDLAHLHASPEQFDSRQPDASAANGRDRDFLRAQAENHMSVLPQLYLHIWRGALPYNLIERQQAINAVFDFHRNAAASQDLLRVEIFFAYYIGHHHFAAMDCEAHCRERAQEGY